MIHFNVVIPARYASERLPGKPLRLIADKPMLQHVHERACESSAAAVVIATDDERVREAARKFGADVCMTSTEHSSGTDRLAEVCASRDWPGDLVVVNLQGDEPMMPAELINQCASLMEDQRADLATLASALADPADLQNPNVVKVLTDANDFALYFSRAAIPFSREQSTDGLTADTARHHHGIYAYRVATLKQIVAAEQSPIERCEKLEQLRAMSIGLKIKVATPLQRPGPGIDTEEDLQLAEKQMAD